MIGINRSILYGVYLSQRCRRAQKVTLKDSFGSARTHRTGEDPAAVGRHQSNIFISLAIKPNDKDFHSISFDSVGFSAHSCPASGRAEQKLFLRWSATRIGISFYPPRGPRRCNAGRTVNKVIGYAAAAVASIKQFIIAEARFELLDYYGTVGCLRLLKRPLFLPLAICVFRLARSRCNWLQSQQKTIASDG